MKEYHIITVSNFLRGLMLLRYVAIRTGGQAIVRGFWNSYYKVSLRPAPELYDVTLPIDHYIPFRHQALRVYLTFYVPLIAYAGALYRYEGKSALIQIRRLLLDLVQLYRDAGLVFTRTQTSFKRTGSGFFVGMLRWIDREKNSAPSVHVVVAAFTYCRGIQLLQDFRFLHAARVDVELKKAVVRIIDSTLLIKQHCVQDVALGLALVSFRYPGYIPALRVLIDNICEHTSTRMSVQVVQGVRTEIRRLFDERIQAMGGITEMEEYLATLPVRESDIRNG